MRVIISIENGRYVMRKEHENVVTLNEIARLRKEKIREAEKQSKQRTN